MPPSRGLDSIRSSNTQHFMETNTMHMFRTAMSQCEGHPHHSYSKSIAILYLGVISRGLSPRKVYQSETKIDRDANAT